MEATRIAWKEQLLPERLKYHQILKEVTNQWLSMCYHPLKRVVLSPLLIIPYLIKQSNRPEQGLVEQLKMTWTSQVTLMMEINNREYQFLSFHSEVTTGSR